MLFRSALQGRLEGERARVYDSFAAWGPATTRRIAEATGLSLWNVRPRTCELVQVGLLECVGKQGHDGVYAAVRLQEALRRAEEARRPQQMAMRLGV